MHCSHVAMWTVSERLDHVVLAREATTSIETDSVKKWVFFVVHIFIKCLAERSLGRLFDIGKDIKISLVIQPLARGQNSFAYFIKAIISVLD